MQSHIMRRDIQFSTVCRCAIYWTLPKLNKEISISFLTHQLNGVGPDQTPHFPTVCICPFCEILCSNRLDGLDVITYVANYDISAKSAGPDQMPHYAESHLGLNCFYYVPFMGHSAY